LLNGMPLDRGAVLAEHICGPVAFHLASSHDDATFFALRRAPGAVVSFVFAASAIAQLHRLGVVERPIPQSPGSPCFNGDEMVLPPRRFADFNALRASGEIPATA